MFKKYYKKIGLEFVQDDKELLYQIRSNKVTKESLMKNIEKKFISTYAFHARYREFYKILNLK